MQAAAPAQSGENASDLELARRTAAGDRQSFTRLMRRHNQTLYRTARGILGDDAEAEDACQEAWIRAYRSMSGFRADAKLSTWLVRIAANEALARYRQRRRRGEVVWLEGESDPTEPDPEDTMSEEPWAQPERAAFRSQTRRLLEATIDQLPATFRAVFVLRAVEDMSVEETAQCLGIPAPTVRTRYFRARALLRQALEREIELGCEDAFSFAGERCDRIVAGVLARLDEARPNAD